LGAKEQKGPGSNKFEVIIEVKKQISRWGRIVSTDLALNVETGKLIYAEDAD